MSSIFDLPELNATLFFPRKIVRPPPPFAEDRRIAVEGAELHLRWHRRLADAPTVLFFHGNAEVVSDYDSLAEDYANLGANLAVVDYRGYGASTGVPRLRDVLADAHRVLAAIDAERIVVMGRSLGSASAAELYPMQDARIRGFVWESGFVDLDAFVRRRGMTPPDPWSEAERAVFDPAAKLRRGSHPLLVLHGGDDTLIVPAEGERAFAAAGTTDKEIVIVPERGHNAVSAHPIYWEALARFVARVTKEQFVPSPVTP